MMMYRFFLVCFNILLSTQVWALDSEDFAYGADIISSDNKPFYELSIPLHIYQNTLQKELGDLRIFNAKHQVLPHAFKKHQAPQSLEKLQQTIPIFPIYAAKNDTLNDFHLNIKNNQYEQVIDQNTKTGKDTAFLRAYIVDLRHWNKPLDRLNINFDKHQLKHWTHKISIDRSDDLNNWVNIVEEKLLLNLSYQGQTLEQNTINLTPLNSRYLRLLFLAHDNLHKIDNIQVSHQRKNPEQKQQWLRVDVKASQKKGEYSFSNPLNTSINALDIHLPEQNSLVKVNVLSRQSKNHPWVNNNNASLYRIKLDNTQIKNSLITFPPSSHTEWKLEIDQQGGGLGTPLTQLKISYPDKKIIFLARGNAPYKARWGSIKVQAVSPKSQQLVLDSLNSASQNHAAFVTKAHINISSIESFNAQAIIHSPPSKDIDWQQILLWVILILAALMLIYMALQLMKKISQ